MQVRPAKPAHGLPDYSLHSPPGKLQETNSMKGVELSSLFVPLFGGGMEILWNLEKK